jgi:hypothetical protein
MKQHLRERYGPTAPEGRKGGRGGRRGSINGINGIIESLVSMSASAMKMDEFDSSLSILCHFKGDVPATNLRLPLLYSIGPSENQLYNQILVASNLQPPLHPMTVYAVFPTLFGPNWACTPLLPTRLEHFQRRGVLIFTHPNHRKRQADVHSTSVYLNGVAI